MRLLSLLLLLVLALALTIYSCNPLPNNGIPFYVAMDSVTFSTTYESQGANDQNFIDAWVTSGANNLGAFQLPINFPVLQSGYTSFVVSGGVQEDGDPNTLVIYPLIKVDTFSINAVPGQKYSHQPHYSYLQGVQFPFRPEDFEQGSDYPAPGNNQGQPGMSKSQVNNTLYPSSHFVGDIYVPITAPDSNVMVSQALSPYALTAGYETWVEIDYMCQIPFYFGYNAYYNGTSAPAITPVLFIDTTSTWHKLYISLENDIGVSLADGYTLYFEALRPLGSPGGHVYLDNIKLIYLP